MVEFRKAFLLLAVLVLVTGIASAQQSTCSVTATPSTARAEGFAEPLGEVRLDCSATGVTDTPGNTINVVLRLGTEVTSRLVDGVLESKLISSNWATPIQGVRTGDFEITFNGVPFNPGGSVIPATLRIVNVRGNATRVGGGALNAILAAVTVSGGPTSSVPLVTQSGAFLPVALVSESLTFTAEVVPPPSIPSSSSATAFTLPRNQCDFQNVVVNLKWAERIAAAFRSMTAENILTGPPIVSPSGEATNATWLRARLTNIPVGARIEVSSNTITVGTLVAERIITTGAIASGSAGTLPSVDLPSGDNPTRLTISADGSADIFYRVTASDPNAQETLTVPITISWPSSSTLPPLGDAFGTAAGGYAPFDANSNAATSKTTAPRFTTNLQQRANPLFSISSCVTRLLFPFVAYDGQFETGIAISNTSKDPFNTRNQTGRCQLWFFGQGTADGTTQTTSVDIASGKQLLFTVGGGNAAAGITPVGNFVGYMVAQCNFQFAHGYAFISDVGADDFAQGYLALVLETPRPLSEKLDN